MTMESDFAGTVAYQYALSVLKLKGLVLKDKQLEAIQHIYKCKDIFLWVATGYGKSICFQTLPFLFDAKLA